MPFVRAGMDGDTVGAGREDYACHFDDAGITDVSLIAEQCDLVEVDAEFGVAHW